MTPPGNQALLAPGAALLLAGGTTTALSSGDDWATTVGVAVVMVGGIALLVACLLLTLDEHGANRRVWLATFWVLELVFIAAAMVLQLSDLWEWWSQGERFTGPVVELVEVDSDDDNDDRIVVRHPVTELGFTIGREGEKVGDLARVVIHPRDQRHGARPDDLRTWLGGWLGLGLAAALWPIGYWRWYLPRWHPDRHRGSTRPGGSGEPTALAGSSP